MIKTSFSGILFKY